MKPNFPIRVSGPTILLSVLLLVLCAVAAGYVLYQQQTSAEVHVENIRSVQAAHDLENTLSDLIILLRNKIEVEPLYERLDSQMTTVSSLADKETEKTLVRQLEASIERFREVRRESRTDSFDVAVKELEKVALPLCQDLRKFNAEEIVKSESAHRQWERWMILGLAGIGVSGALTGLLLGYAVARRLQRSIAQLSVRVRDAADRLGQDLPAVTLDDGDLGHLNEQMQTMVKEIEQVVDKLQQREREVLRAKRMAALGQLAASVAHELRNPLTSIKLLTQVYGEEAEARGTQVEDLRIIEQEIRRMERCLQTFLDFARPSEPERRRVNLFPIVERTFTLIGGRARKQQVELKLICPDGSVFVDADGEQMQQLLVNLALNALDAMPSGGTLEVDLRYQGSDQVQLRVQDTGLGISAQVLPVLFEPFVSSKETGLGLGLVISRRIAESHGGSLEAENRPGRGACFTLRLPRSGVKSQGSGIRSQESGIRSHAEITHH